MRTRQPPRRKRNALAGVPAPSPAPSPEGATRREAIVKVAAGVAGAAVLPVAATSLLSGACAGGRHALGPAAEFRQGMTKVDGLDVVVVRDGDDLGAMSTRCTHQNCPLDIVRASLDPSGWNLRCPCHAGPFGASGEPLGGPPTVALDRYELMLSAGGELSVNLAKPASEDARLSL